LDAINSKGVVHIVDHGGTLAEKAHLFEAIGLEPSVHRSPLQFLKGFTHAKPCCLVSAMRLPELPGLELLALLQRQRVPPPMIMITAYGDIKSAVQAMKLGAAEFLETPVDDELLLRLAQNWIRVDRARHAKANKCATVREKLSKLSAREREVLSGLLDSQSNKEIATRLNISPKSVEVYRSKLMAKMEVCSIPNLVRDVLCCPVFQCGPLDFGYLCTGVGCVNNALGQDSAFDTSKEIHFSRIEYAASKRDVNASRGGPNCDR
jgi:two-component system, LuxR family, response regulator FixJ